MASFLGELILLIVLLIAGVAIITRGNLKTMEGMILFGVGLILLLAGLYVGLLLAGIGL